MSKAAISVIVPIYKAEKYLSRCIESILNQTYKDYELILVDDGSPDNSGKICDYYADKDLRIKVIHKENGGVSSARNIGIEKAQGDWITFVDSDDWVENNYLSLMYGKIVNSSVDLIIASMDIRTIRIIPDVLQNNLINIKENVECEFYIDSNAHSGPVAKLYNKRILMKNNIRFAPNIKYAEDTLFFLKYLGYCSLIETSDAVIYHYNCLNINNACGKFYEQKIDWLVAVMREAERFINTTALSEEEKKRALLRRACQNFYDVCGMFVKHKNKEEALYGIRDSLKLLNHWLAITCYNSEEFNLNDYAVLESENENAVYNYIKTKLKKGKIKEKIKCCILKVVKPFVEKYRDELKKFNLKIKINT